MRSIFGSASRLFSIYLILALTICFTAPVRAQQSTPTAQHNPLAQILLTKGILTPDEVKSIDQAATPQLASECMARMLLGKGVISKADYERIAGGVSPVSSSSVSQAVQAQVPAAKQPQPVNPPQATGLSASMSAQRPPHSTEPGDPSLAATPSTTGFISALTPIRALPMGIMSQKAMVPAFKADGVGITPYGFIKVTAIEDSSSPDGDDFPLPGFLSDTGPDGSPEFHIKARSSRVGADFVWYDPRAEWTISGKLEMDFEGNFNRSDNRNLSSIRSSNPSLRLAWGRLDYRLKDRNSFSALFGQDWTPFGSSTLPNILETTGLGIGFGTLYERAPQMRFGYTHKTAGIQVMPEFALVLPAVGLVPSSVSNQLGYGERQGPDSNRPDLEGRLVVQWQLDHAHGVAPAQAILSAEHGDRAADVLGSDIPVGYQASFSAGAVGRSHTDGWDFEWQLPTRYATLIGKFYSGADLRYFFANQLYSFYNDTTGLRVCLRSPEQQSKESQVDHLQAGIQLAFTVLP